MKAHNMEMMITNHRSKLSSSDEFKKDSVNSKKSSKPPKASMKETMTVSTIELMQILGKSRPKGKKNSFFKETTKKRPTLKELQGKKYLFLDSDLSEISDDLLESKIIKLFKPKRPEKARRINDPKYYCYHRVINHPLDKCITLKEHIMKLAKDGRIILDLDDIIEANCICAQLESSPLR